MPGHADELTLSCYRVFPRERPSGDRLLGRRSRGLSIVRAPSGFHSSRLDSEANYSQWCGLLRREQLENVEYRCRADA